MSFSGSILSAVGAAGQLFAGYGSVTLGPIRFYGLGKPKSMAIGGKQAITIHKLPGGGRVLDAMGPDNADIAWCGYLDGADASITAQALDRLRQSGQAVVLTWDIFSYRVLVSQFSCQIQHIPMRYEICCTVISDNTQIAAVALTSIGLDVTADLANGNPIATLSAGAQAIVGSAIDAAGIAATAAGATTIGSAAYTGAVSAVDIASGALGAATATANAMLAPIGSSLSSLSAVAPTAVDTIGMSEQIVIAATICGDLAQLSAAAGYVSRAAANLRRASA